jgi:4-diphosphocytidyl-2-C-methyl-D-erythritol kinase
MHAPAKLNLSLAVNPEITGGKHLLRSVFTTISLADQLIFEYQPDLPTALSIDMQFKNDVDKIPIPLHKNIIYQAIRAFEARFGYELTGKLYVSVTKNIPTQAGLGGGSSDAATTLKAMVKLSGDELDVARSSDELSSRVDSRLNGGANSIAAEASNASGIELSSTLLAASSSDPSSTLSSKSVAKLSSVAAELGADVAFFLEGGCALMGGHGEQLLHRLHLPELDIVLVKPNTGLSTALVYQEFSRNPAPATTLDEMVELLQNAKPSGSQQFGCQQSDSSVTPQAVANLLANNLTPAATSLMPEIAEITEQLEAQPGIYKALLAGSGSTVFAVAANPQAAIAAASHFKTKGYWTQVCKTVK